MTENQIVMGAYGVLLAIAMMIALFVMLSQYEGGCEIQTIMAPTPEGVRLMERVIEKAKREL